MGYFDIQVNGYGGVDYNQDDLSVEELRSSCVKLAEDGVEGILATIITESLDRMVHRIGKIVRLREQDPLIKKMIAGLHMEGPFLSPLDGYRGAHPLDAILSADMTSAGKLLDAGGGLIRLLTLAPEHDPGAKVAHFLTLNGVRVAAGHTNASLDQLKESIDSGLCMATHLGNACPQLLPRHDNIIQRILFLRKYLWLSFIADGVHIPFEMLRNYIDLAGIGERALVTTDAMSAAGLGVGRYKLGRWDVQVGEDLAVRSADGSHLVGSAVSMKRIDRNLSSFLKLSAEEIHTLTWVNPRKSIGII
ncbi:MAG: N-acetylglucosamine-6-phosphate deacetylase [Verrucomicrobiota bacterium]